VFNIVLYQPEIPPNTGNIIRLCANTGCRLHLIEPLGFEPDDARLRRAGLDYGDWTQALRHNSFEEFLVATGPERLFTFSKHHSRLYSDAGYRSGDAFLFGPETRGLPASVRDSVPEDCRLTLPMLPGNRSLNLSNAVAVVVYEAWRQLGFAGA
jgi:tRNA (cytidine/uridine-2'-O-)-methyltransferase